MPPRSTPYLHGWPPSRHARQASNGAQTPAEFGVAGDLREKARPARSLQRAPICWVSKPELLDQEAERSGQNTRLETWRGARGLFVVTLRAGRFGRGSTVREGRLVPAMGADCGAIGEIGA